MEIKIKTTGKRIELVNFVLAQAVSELKHKKHIRENMQLTGKEVEEIEKFRKAMIKIYMNK